MIGGVVADYTRVVLICWAHQHIPAIAATLPTVWCHYSPSWPEIPRSMLAWVVGGNTIRPSSSLRARS
jgi:hypothetical protein